MTTREAHAGALVLVADDVEETRDGIEKLLSADGYCVDLARNEDDAVDRARRQRPDLILLSLAGRRTLDVIASAARIRKRAGLGHSVPVVMFCVPIVEEGAEVEVGKNLWATRPDNFDQLRDFIGWVLWESTTLD